MWGGGGGQDFCNDSLVQTISEGKEGEGRLKEAIGPSRLDLPQHCTYIQYMLRNFKVRIYTNNMGKWCCGEKCF